MFTSLHPLLRAFLKLTLLVAGAIVVFVIVTALLGLVVKAVLVAAVVAAVVIGGLFLYNLLARRVRLPVIR